MKEDNVRSVYRLRIGLHMCYNGCYRELPQCKLVLSFKSSLSSDCYLKFDSMKQESLVIAYHHEAVNFNILSYTLPVRRQDSVKEGNY